MFENEADFEKTIGRLKIDDKPNPEHCETLRREMLSIFGESSQKHTAPFGALRRKFMKSRITKLAAIVTIAITVLAIGLWDKSTPAAYAIEQTVEAMREVTSAHCFVTTVTGERIEMWIKVNPQTGENEYYYMDSPDKTVVASPDGTYMYQKKQNVVIHMKGSGYVRSDVRFGRFIEDMIDAAETSNGKIEIKSQNVDGEKPVILLIIETDELTLESRVDSETKLPMSMNLKFKGKPQPGQIGQSIDEMSYNDPLPEGIFNFKIPEGAQVLEMKQ